MDFEVTITVLLETPHSRIFKKFLDGNVVEGVLGKPKMPLLDFLLDSKLFEP